MTTQKPSIDLPERFAGLLLGTAVGDALGLPAENLSAQRIRRLWKGQWKMRFIFGRGMVSDDTEHTLMVAQALLSESKDAAEFQRILAWKFRWWFVGLPGGVGLATAKACLKLWIPLEWLGALWEWPRSPDIMEQISARLVEQQSSSQSRGPVHYFWPVIILRNFLFLVTVLLHGFRRFAPPY